MSISLSGTSASLRSMVERVAASGMLMHAKSFEMYPSSPTRQSLTLDMELWYFTLARKRIKHVGQARSLTCKGLSG